MLFSVEIVFVGLCLFCLDHVENASCARRDGMEVPESPGTVYLVDARDRTPSCGGHPDLEGGHVSRLTFVQAPGTFIAPTLEVSYSISPSGDRVGTIDLVENAIDEICTSTSVAGTRRQRLRINGGPSKKRGKPLTRLAMVRPYTWMTAVKAVDGRATHLKDSVEAEEGPVAARIRLTVGTLSTRRLARYREGTKLKRFASVRADDSGEARAITEQVLLRIESLKRFKLTDCNGRDLVDLPEVRFRRGVVRISISNSPTGDIRKGREIEHYRWFHRLFEGDSCRVPVIEGPSQGGDSTLVLGGNTYCPPADGGG